MRIGVPREVKPHETRTAVTPELAARLTGAGHDVLVQRGTGLFTGLSDEQYTNAGAHLVDTAAEVWAGAEFIVKVKEPIAIEYPLFRPEHVIFSYLHLAAVPECQQALVDAGCVGIGFETVELADGSLPLLAPMSTIAGRLAVQFGVHYLTAPQGGRGVLLGGIEGVAPGRVVVIGAGSAGRGATAVALGLAADVTVVDRNPVALQQVQERWPNRLTVTGHTDSSTLHELVKAADLVVCTALVAGARAPVLLTEDDVAAMPRGAVLVDVAVDQGGNCTLSRPTTHGQPTFESHGILISCITNLPAAVPRTSTFALSAAIAPYVLTLADKGWRRACAEDPALALGVNVSEGEVVHPALL